MIKMNEEDFITKFYSCDNEEQFLKDICHNLNCLQKVQNNWNELKKWLDELDKTFCETMVRDDSKFYHFQRGELMFLRNTKLKLQEMEQGKDE